MVDLDIEAIKARAAAATEPIEGDRWMYEKDGPDGRWLVASGKEFHRDDRGHYDSEDFGYWCEEADAAFVANARGDVPALVTEVERLQALVDDFPDREAILTHEAHLMQAEAMSLNNAWIGGPDQEWREIQRQCNALDDAAEMILNRLRKSSDSSKED